MATYLGNYGDYSVVSAYGSSYAIPVRSVPTSLTVVSIEKPLSAAKAAHAQYHIRGIIGEVSNRVIGQKEINYDRIWAIPEYTDLGSITNPIQIPIEVWNAYEQSVSLLSIDQSGVHGLSLIQPAPTPDTYNNLQSKNYTVDVSLEGPATISASYSFIFDIGTAVSIITGSRVVAWIFPPYFEEDMVERLTWLTSVIPSDDSTEQRFSLRQRPAREFSYFTAVNGHYRNVLESLLWGWQSKKFLLPIWYAGSKLLDAAQAGASVISVDTDYLDYVPGGNAIITDGSLRYEAIKIQSVNVGSITSVSPLIGDWEAGVTVMPARLATLKEAQDTGLITQDFMTLSLTFDVDDLIDVTPAELGDSVYKNTPVLMQAPDWAGGINRQYKRDLNILNNPVGRDLIVDRSGRPTVEQEYRWFLSGNEKIKSFYRWLYQRAGRRRMLFVPSFSPDMEMLSYIPGWIDISNISYTQVVGQQPGRRDIAVLLKNGSVYFNRIVSSEVISSSVERLFLEFNFPSEITADDVKVIYWMQLHRLSSDSIEISWKNFRFAVCKHSLLGLNHDI